MTGLDRALLDTSALIDLGKPGLRLPAVAAPAVSAVTIGELAYGLDTADPVERGVRLDRYQAVVENFEVLPFDFAAAKTYGVLASLVRAAGRDPRPRRMDLQIAATAAVGGMPLLTRNAKDFVGLERVVTVIEV